MAAENEIKRLGDIPYYQKKQYKKEVMLAGKQNDEWTTYSTAEVIEEINSISAGLHSLDLKSGDKIGIISSNRPEWNFVDLGAQQIGIITVPIYPKISKDEITHILTDAEIMVLVIENEEVLEKIDDELREQLKRIVSIDPINGIDPWTEIKTTPDQNKIRQLADKVKEEDVATLVYTSGTTGNPKGVMLTHTNILSNALACLKIMPVGKEHTALSFLPLNHIFERMLNYLYMIGGISIYYAESIDKIGDNLKEVRPHIFTTVPRLLEKIYEKIVNKGESLSLLQKGIFFWALRLAQRYQLQDNSWFYRLQQNLADRIVYKKWREAVGSRIIAIISGGAALDSEINRVFNAAKIPVMEGYGLTETSPVIAVNRYETENRKIGSVGPVLEGVEVKLDESGEILCKGPNVMQGYYKLDDKTDEVLKNGWFHTGDIGDLKQGFLHITDRKKHLFKTSGGKYVSPQRIESVMKKSRLIAQVLAIGEGKKMVTALIVPNFENLKEWCKSKSLNCESHEEMVQQEEVISRFKKLISDQNSQLNHTEEVKKFQLLSAEWTEENQELTPTMKLKRQVIHEKHKKEIEELYEDGEAISIK